jgi:hypothetical protein
VGEVSPLPSGRQGINFVFDQQVEVRACNVRFDRARRSRAATYLITRDFCGLGRAPFDSRAYAALRSQLLDDGWGSQMGHQQRCNKDRNNDSLSTIEGDIAGCADDRKKKRQRAF